MKIFDRLTLLQVRDTDLSDVHADILTYGHVNRRDKVSEWRDATGKKCLGYMNLLHSWPNAGTWGESGWQRKLFDIATRNDAWMKDNDGNPLIFPWFSQGPLYDFRNKELRDAAIFLADEQDFGDGIWLDMVFDFPRTWMDLHNRVAAIGGLEWFSVLHQILSGIGFDRILINGTWTHSGVLWTMLENSDGKLPEAYPHWHTKNILSVNGPPESIEPIIQDAKRMDRIIECKNVASRDRAIEVRDA